MACLSFVHIRWLMEADHGNNKEPLAASVVGAASFPPCLLQLCIFNGSWMKSAPPPPPAEESNSNFLQTVKLWSLWRPNSSSPDKNQHSKMLKASSSAVLESRNYSNTPLVSITDYCTVIEGHQTPTLALRSRVQRDRFNQRRFTLNNFHLLSYRQTNAVIKDDIIVFLYLFEQLTMKADPNKMSTSASSWGEGCWCVHISSCGS